MITKRISRRDFIKNASIAGAGLTIPLFFPSNATAKEDLWSGLSRTSEDGRILIVLELAGGNDGLNTVAPYAEDAYYRARPRLGIDKSKVLRLNDHIGLNDNLSALKSLYDDGHVAIVNGVGYENPNRSHFRSMEIWRTASDSDEYESEGWLGNFFDQHAGVNPDPLCGVALATEFPQSFYSASGLGVSFERADLFRWLEGPAGDNQQAFRRLNRISETTFSHADTLDFLRHVTANIVRSSDRVIEATQIKRSGVEYPRSPLGRHLETVAQLIAGGLPTSIYYVSYGGFDTHAAQSGRHDNLLKGFGEAVSAFMRDMQAHKLDDRVLILCFSEFGRRVEQNASNGTDHGTAGPMFLIGGSVNPGLHGRYPSLTDLDNGDLKYTVDFRSVYATVLEDWKRADSAAILGRNFNTLDLIKT